MGKASKGKKLGKNRRSAAASPSLPASPVNAGIVRTARENVVGIVNQGRDLDRAVEIATSAFFLADHLVWRFEVENPLPQPLACQEGCDACCYNLVELTPPEALLLGHHIDQHFADVEKDRVLTQMARNLALAAGQSKVALATARKMLPCPLLRGRGCSVYPIRPLVCRAMHALNRERCEADLQAGSLAGSQYYSHRHEIVLSVSAGVLAGCRAVGCQADALSLDRALHDLFTQEDCAERWIGGEAVFGL